jgi:hypothetical protein
MMPTTATTLTQPFGATLSSSGGTQDHRFGGMPDHLSGMAPQPPQYYPSQRGIDIRIFATELMTKTSLEVKEFAKKTSSKMSLEVKEFAKKMSSEVKEVAMESLKTANEQNKRHDDAMKRKDDAMKRNDDPIQLLISPINIDGNGVAAPAATNARVFPATASVAPDTATSFSFGDGMLHSATPGVSSTVAHSHGGSSATSSFAWGATVAGTDNGGSSAASTNYKKRKREWEHTSP